VEPLVDETYENCDKVCAQVSCPERTQNNLIVIPGPQPLSHFFSLLAYVMNCN